MSTVETIEKVITSGSCDLTSFKKVEAFSKPDIDISDAFILIYNWPDDPEGANATIHVELTYFFIHNNQEYKAVTKTTFYDYDIDKFENLHKYYFITEYPLLVKQALILSKQKIEKELKEPLTSIIPFNFDDDKTMLLSMRAGSCRQIDYV
ncbi:hypothetical protein C7448_101777 [Tenacibaculum gallaicum]|uniref:Uncharacterized protein n=1 Tax=Tenacibaculum gallaicum TaxID=561505 RepID=A0A3E0IDB1_9FLAO|nr:hypothetical protein [Tenacibaculum gallaicum]REH56734.1 hypothetical protein C7448_101777 [Tenacibaculum gallaicum]